MSKSRLIFISGLISVIIILVTGWIASYSDVSILGEICFYFHFIPFGIGFAGGGAASILLYYSILWIVLTVIMIPIVSFFDSAKNKRLILVSTFLILALGFLIILWIDHSIENKREERRSQREREEKQKEREDRINFKPFRTGDIIFQTQNHGDSISYWEDTSSESSRIGMIYVSDEHYFVLEINDWVHLAWLRMWVEQHGSFTIKRLVNADSVLTEERIEKLRNTVREYDSKPYDDSHCWSDVRMYGSELIWKVYKRALGVELGALEHSANANKSSSEQVECSGSRSISTRAIFNSDKLVTIMQKK